MLSAGVLAEDGLRERLERAAGTTGAPLYVPSGGIGAVGALKAAVVAGVDTVIDPQRHQILLASDAPSSASSKLRPTCSIHDSSGRLRRSDFCPTSH